VAIPNVRLGDRVAPKGARDDQHWGCDDVELDQQVIVPRVEYPLSLITPE
jgi:hypothetical protein